jgi:high-affinity nickel-transport protein
MCLMDTVDGAFMSQAYGWAFANPIRRIYYNITVTTLSVAVALVIGSIELLQVAGDKLSLEGGLWQWLAGLDFSSIGYGIVAMFFLTWLVSALIWKQRHIEERWGAFVEGPPDVSAR